MDEFTNKVANAFLSMGYKKGDEVALMMGNCPQFIFIWLGLAKIGVVAALINTNLREDALGHSINTLNIRAIVFEDTFSDVVSEALPFIKNKDVMDYFSFSGKDKAIASSFPCKSLNSLLDDASAEKINLGDKKVGNKDKLFYIYTSGTTGLPKPAIIRHSRYLWMCSASKYMLQLGDFEIFYNPLPLYHSSGNVLFVGVVLVFGGKMVIQKKFSASNFWKDIVKHKATVSQYIGEICRYLLNQPKTSEEKQHSLKLIYGNGLRAHIWKEFQERFQIERVVELYGSTEGNANLVNIFDKVGAVGFVPRILDHIYPVYLIKVHSETGEILRGKNGLCIRCKPGESGELVGKIVHSSPLNSFDGYADKKATSKKLVRNCFKKGDTVFLSGDIMVMDEDGYLYFLDRTGDTFRWKGENVSTGEVENIVSKALNHVACVVYGVEVPKIEGKAGMAAVQIDLKNINCSELYKNIMKKLPSYAVPIFLRVSDNLESTGTYKLRKVTLQKEGFDPNQISDPLFFLDHKQNTYVPLTKDLYSDIISGRIKL